MIARRKPIARQATPIARSPLKRKPKPRRRRAVLHVGLVHAKTGKRPKDTRAERREATLDDGAEDREKVRERQRGRCYARDVSPVCQGPMMDPHELIPRSRGGPLVSWNRVGVCRADHREAQGRVGGNRLVFTWPGKDEGRPPNADEPGNVTAIWRPRPNAAT